MINKKSKKAQLKIQEMSFMIMAVFLFFVLVGLFAFALIYSNLNKQANEIAKQRAYSSITNLADAPEFICTGSRPNCIDADKVLALIEYESKNKNYENFWPFTSLIVIKSSGFDKSEANMIPCTKLTYPNCDKFVVYDKHVRNEAFVSSFVAICRNDIDNNLVYEKCEIAKLIAGSKREVD